MLKLLQVDVDRAGDIAAAEFFRRAHIHQRMRQGVIEVARLVLRRLHQLMAGGARPAKQSIQKAHAQVSFCERSSFTVHHSTPSKICRAPPDCL
jgi:hypothetical protein